MEYEFHMQNIASAMSEQFDWLNPEANFDARSQNLIKPFVTDWTKPLPLLGFPEKTKDTLQKILQQRSLMSAQTLIIFVVFKLPKHTKTIKKLSKYLNYPRDCVLCVLNAKCAKTKEKRSKFAILAVSVPQVSKLVKISPYAFILKGKVNPSF
jgi:DNA polymerase III delta subunit